MRVLLVAYFAYGSDRHFESGIIFVNTWIIVTLCLFCLSRSATLEHYKAGMLLSGVGDALGYRNQLWEYNESGPVIHQVSGGPAYKQRSYYKIWPSGILYRVSWDSKSYAK